MHQVLAVGGLLSAFGLSDHVLHPIGMVGNPVAGAIAFASRHGWWGTSPGHCPSASSPREGST